MLVLRRGESLTQLLELLDLAVGKALHEKINTDEINTLSATERAFLAQVVSTCKSVDTISRNPASTNIRQYGRP